ncbi:MAG: amidohydrolase family protein [Acidobacteria bacterium]|nr:amidohydrolase family protein [Acidobacteriota bacterium]MCI0718812.1 amidohydrolase family protein [Acidobacteriota bacterium]
MDVLQTLKDLIAIPSINPMRADSGEPAERAAADYTESLLRREHIDCERQKEAGPSIVVSDPAHAVLCNCGNLEGAGNPMAKILTGCLSLLLVFLNPFALPQQPRPKPAIREFLALPQKRSSVPQAITGVRLIDGRNGEPQTDMTVLVINGRISSVGSKKATAIPQGAQVIDGSGMTLLPGLMDSHFHLDGAKTLPALFLSHGITSVRDPGAWIEAYQEVRQSKATQPRLFLAGPHLDGTQPAYPRDSVVVRDAMEVRLAVKRSLDDGASVLKAYFRLPLALIEEVTRLAHARGIPVTAHLEIVDAGDAIRAGIDGIEHATSVGPALLPPREAEAYRQAVLADNGARSAGRYRVWSQIDLKSERADRLLKLMVSRNVTLSPTLAVFERRPGDRDITDMHVQGFRQMLTFTGQAKRAGVRVVVGSHSSVAHAERGWAYQREMELLVEAGLTPMQAIQAGTLENAKFFRVDDRLGSIEAGKQADLLLVEGDPSQDISAMRRVKRVMIDGVWVE